MYCLYDLTTMRMFLLALTQSSSEAIFKVVFDFDGSLSASESFLFFEEGLDPTLKGF